MWTRTATCTGGGTMRLATAADEILPLRDATSPAKCRLSDDHPALAGHHPAGQRCSSINTRVIEGLFTMDLAYLQDLYQRINLSGIAGVQGDLPPLQPGD